MKKIILFCLSLVITFSLFALPVFAETQRPLIDKVRTGTPTASHEAIKQEKMQVHSDNLKQRATNEINRRLEALKKLLSRISEFKKISDSQKSSLTAEVQTEIDSLTTLLAKITADTDDATIKTDVQSIITSYRVFALFMPQIEIIGAADRILTISDEMSTQADKLGAKITDAQGKGKDVTELQSWLSDMKTKIADAKTQAQHAIDTVTPLKPADYPGNKTTLQNGRQMVVTALKDLNTARQDGRKILMGLMKLGVLSALSGTPHPQLTCTPRPKCLDFKPSCKIAITEHMCPKTNEATSSAGEQ